MPGMDMRDNGDMSSMGPSMAAMAGYMYRTPLRPKQPSDKEKAKAVVAVMTAFSAMPDIDGVNYANVDECDLYPSGYFTGGCLVDALGNRLPTYGALAALAKTYF